jgi:hypothetical protein
MVESVNAITGSDITPRIGEYTITFSDMFDYCMFLYNENNPETLVGMTCNLLATYCAETTHYTEFTPYHL